MWRGAAIKRKYQTIQEEAKTKSLGDPYKVFYILPEQHKASGKHEAKRIFAKPKPKS